MINVREGTFETNSSSAHNVVIVEDSQLKQWENGNLFFIESKNKFITKAEKENLIKSIYGELVLKYAEDPSYQNDIADAIKKGTLKEFVKEMIEEEEWYYYEEDLPISYSEWRRKWENRDLEDDERDYVTPKGEKIHIFCQFGYDG